MTSRVRPLPRNGKDDVAVRELQHRSRQERQRLDRDVQIAKNADGAEEVTIPSGGSVVLFHTLKRLARWRFLRLATDGLAAGPVVEAASAATNESLTLVNLSGVDMIVVVEVL